MKIASMADVHHGDFGSAAVSRVGMQLFSRNFKESETARNRKAGDTRWYCNCYSKEH
jgi:hypothetical protein